MSYSRQAWTPVHSGARRAGVSVYSKGFDQSCAVKGNGGYYVRRVRLFGLAAVLVVH